MVTESIRFRNMVLGSIRLRDRGWMGGVKVNYDIRYNNTAKIAKNGQPGKETPNGFWLSIP